MRTESRKEAIDCETGNRARGRNLHNFSMDKC